MQKFFKQFSFPGGIGSHATPETPGSIHEGGELGYSISHAFGAVYDHPSLIAVTMVGDGEAETGPLATSWHSTKFLKPHHRRRRAAGAAPQRLQDQQPDGAGAHQPQGARGPLRRLRLAALLRRGRTTSTRCTRPWRPRSRSASSTSGGTRRRRATRARPCGPAGPWWCSAPPRAGPAPASSTTTTSRASGAPTRSPSPTSARTPSTSRCSSAGCAATSPTASSARTAASATSSRPCAPQATTA